MSELKPSFGDVIENGYASEGNPTRRGFFVRAFKRTGRLNPGLTWEITDKLGKFWEVQPAVIGERLTVIPAARAEGPAQVSAPLDREWVARIIDPLGWQLFDEVVRVQQLPPSEAQAAFEACPAAPWSAKERTDIALAKADAILALSQQDQVGLTTPAVLGEPSADALRSGGEEFLEFKEALSDLRRLRHEHDCLNGGGPGWTARNAAAWARADELFANDDEAAYDRQQEDAHG
jgi:hypothetical protein